MCHQRIDRCSKCRRSYGRKLVRCHRYRAKQQPHWVWWLLACFGGDGGGGGGGRSANCGRLIRTEPMGLEWYCPRCRGPVTAAGMPQQMTSRHGRDRARRDASKTRRPHRAANLQPPERAVLRGGAGSTGSRSRSRPAGRHAPPPPPPPMSPPPPPQPMSPPPLPPPQPPMSPPLMPPPLRLVPKPAPAPEPRCRRYPPVTPLDRRRPRSDSLPSRRLVRRSSSPDWACVDARRVERGTAAGARLR